MQQQTLDYFTEKGIEAQVALGFSGMEPAKAVPAAYIKKCKTYRDACRMAWQMRRIRNMTYTMLAALCGFYRPHVGDWFNKDDKATRRDMPADCISIFESIIGNTLITQWLAAQSNLTVLEEIQAERALAYA